MRRSLAVAVGGLLFIVGLLSQHPLAILAIAGTGFALLTHAVTGLGPKPILTLPLELLGIFLFGAVAVATVGVVAYWI